MTLHNFLCTSIRSANIVVSTYKWWICLYKLLAILSNYFKISKISILFL